MRIFRFITTIISSILMTSCIINPNKISIAYPNWAEGIAVTHLAREILVEQGFQVELLNADIAPIFTSLARGKTDEFLDSWLPVTLMSPLTAYRSCRSSQNVSMGKL